MSISKVIRLEIEGCSRIQDKKGIKTCMTRIGTNVVR